jgi:hypothetical protein
MVVLQLEGVSSDVVMPDRYAYLKMGERDLENAMPWDKIDADYTVWDKTIISIKQLPIVKLESKIMLNLN